jgi:HEAT repeat protein
VSRRMVWVGLLLIALIGYAVAFSGCGSKPTYTSGGRTASYWAEVLKQPDVEMRRKAAVKIGALMLTDEAALPATLAALKDEDTKVRLAAIRSLKIYAGPKASRAVPALRDVQEHDKDQPVREAAAKAADALTAR